MMKRRRKYLRKEDDSSVVDSVPTDVYPIKTPKTASTSEIGFNNLESYWKKGHNVVIAALIIAVVYAIYYIYNLIRRYWLSKDVEAVINLAQHENSTVGNTLVCRVRFRMRGGKIIPSSSKIFRELEENVVIVIEPCNAALKREIAVLKEFDDRNRHITGKFSLRKCGTYEIKVKYYMFYLTSEPSLTFKVLPGPVSPKFLDFDIHNPHILCLTAGFQQYFKIFVADEFGNRCRIEQVDLEKLDFQIYHMGNLLPVEHEFCYYRSSTSHECSENVSSANDASSRNIALKLTVSQPGVYTCFLKYDDYTVHSVQGAPKLLVCITQEEENELRELFSKFTIPGSLIYSSECRLSFLGDEDGFKNFCVGISAKSLVFALYRIPLTFYPDARFPINERTKIFHSATQIFSRDSDSESITLVVQDGLRPSVRLEMQSPAGRMFLVTFAHNQGFLLPKSTMTFQEKKEGLKSRLTSYFPWFNSEKILVIQHGNLIGSTRKQVPSHPDDWLLPFKINCESGASTVVGVQVWINRLCDEFFKRNKEAGMFQKLNGSKLLHPVSSKISQQPLENYRLVGQILGKAIIETLLRGICTHLSQIRFTRSLLAFVLGYPITFKFLETDEPIYFRKIMTIVESDLTGEEYSFTTYPSSTSDTNIVNLIPNGSNIPVTNANKEHYLNLLANYRLIHTVEQEITAFRTGFFDVIDKDHLSNFQEYDLQQLISGGREFNILDLKAHHRVVKEVDNGFIGAIRRQSMDTKKILNWFWTVTENLSEEEQSYLMFFATGSFSLPSCGLADLNPLFTISLTGTHNQAPKAHPISNEIVLGDHSCFENFERSLLHAIKPESERIVLPTADMICLQQEWSCGNYAEPQEDMEIEEEMEEAAEPRRAISAHGTPSAGTDPFLNWFMELINL